MFHDEMIKTGEEALRVFKACSPGRRHFIFSKSICLHSNPMAVSIRNFDPTEAALKKSMMNTSQDLSVIIKNPVEDYSFDLYNEAVTSEMLLGIDQADFDEVAKGIIEELSIPSNHHKAIMNLKRRRRYKEGGRLSIQ